MEYNCEDHWDEEMSAITKKIKQRSFF
jgi:hypothetical protein